MEDKASRNLFFLKKIDDHILEIVDTAAHIALYEFDVTEVKWIRSGIEGTSFVTRRSQMPLYQLIILNKQGLNNFILDISSIHKIKLQPPYVMIKYSVSVFHLNF